MRTSTRGRLIAAGAGAAIAVENDRLEAEGVRLHYINTEDLGQPVAMGQAAIGTTTMRNRICAQRPLRGNDPP